MSTNARAEETSDLFRLLTYFYYCLLRTCSDLQNFVETLVIATGVDTQQVRSLKRFA